MVDEAKIAKDNRRDEWLWSLIVFSVALAIRLIHLWQLRGAPFADFRMGDAEGYHLWASKIAAGNWWGDEVFYQAPLYPYFLAVVYWAFGDSLGIIRFLQALLGACSCMFLMHAGWRLFDKRVGIASGILLAVYAPAIFFDSQPEKSVLDTFFICGALWLVADESREPRKWRVGWLGLVMAGLILTRENALVLVPAICLWLLLRRNPIETPRWSPVFCFAACLAIVLLPVGLRNWIVGGEFHLTTSQLGPNLYIGNNAAANGLYKPLVPGRSNWRFEREDATRFAEEAVGRELSPGEVSAYFVGQVVQFVRNSPGQWLKLIARKGALLVNSVEPVDTVDQYTVAEYSTLLYLSQTVMHLGVLLPLAVLGSFCAWPVRDRVWVVWLMFACYAISVVAFYVFARYRFPLIPIIILLAAAGIVHGVRFWRSSGWSVRAACGVAMLCAGIVSNLPLVSVATMRATTHFNVAVLLNQQGDLNEAIRHFEQSIAFGSHPDVRSNLGKAYLKAGRLEDAKRELTSALKANPQDAAAHVALGQVFQRQGAAKRAESEFRRAIDLDASLAIAFSNLGQLQLEQNQFEAAAANLQTAVELEPQMSEAWNNLGLAFLGQDKLELAEKKLRTAIDLKPDFAEAHYNLGLALDRQDRLDEAEAAYRRTLSIDEDHAKAHNNLGMALGRQGNLPEAAEHFRRAIRLDPGFAKAYFNLGQVLFSGGHLPQARVHFQRALKLDPSLEQARQQLALIDSVSSSRSPNSKNSAKKK